MTGRPEPFGGFYFWPPDDDGGGWGVSDAGGWLPGILADRDACLTLVELYPARLGIGELNDLRITYNCARPSVLITSQHLREAAP